MIKDEDIIEVTEAFIGIANEGGALEDILRQYQSGKSLAIKITGTRINTGLIIKNGKLHMLSHLDSPTVVVTMDKNLYWDIINAPSAAVARTKLWVGVYTEERILMDPPPGAHGGALHMQNLMKFFSEVSTIVMG